MGRQLCQGHRAETHTRGCSEDPTPCFAPALSLLVSPLLLGAAGNGPRPVVRQREKGRADLGKLVLHSFKEKTEEKMAGEEG